MINATIEDCDNFLLFKDNVDGYRDSGYGVFNNYGEYPLDEAIRKDTIKQVFEEATHGSPKEYQLKIRHQYGESTFQFTDPGRCKQAMKKVLSLANGKS
ncbi:MAG: hypothetical protein WC455_28350 [Dehalococcoidia bacterium]|jgi:hypothetical protein